MVKNENQPAQSHYGLIAVFSVILFHICVLTRHTVDYGIHTASMENTPLRPLLNPFKWIEYFAERGYPLWHITGRLIMRILNCPAEWAAGINSGIWCVLSYIGIVAFLKYLLNDANKKYISILAFSLFLVAPVWLPWKNEFIVLHVGGINVWHNATNICGRAVGILTFFFSMKLLDRILESHYEYLPAIKQCVFLSLLYVISLLAKPSFAQTFAPSFGFLLIFYLARSKGKFLRQFLIFMATALLPVIRLFVQFSHYFGTKDRGRGDLCTEKEMGILFELPTKDAIFHTIDNQILVLMFPIAMIVIMILTKQALDRYHAISWSMLLIGIICILCLKGSATGEMGWAYYIAAFMVFTIGIRDYIKIFYLWKERFTNTKVITLLFIISTVILTEQIITGLFYLYQLIIYGAQIY